MDVWEKDDIFIDNSDFNGRMSIFHDKLKKHLSNEYLFFSEKKDNLENEIIQLELEKSQKDRKLFSNVEKKDVRKYFSPLNLTEIDEEQKDERERLFYENIGRLNEEVELLNNRMEEIKDFLHDIEKMLNGGEEILTAITEKEKNTGISENFFQEFEIGESLLEGIHNIENFLKNRYDDFEILIEIDNKDISCDKAVMKNITRQLLYNIFYAIEDYEVSIVLIEGRVEKDKICITLNYTCEDMQIDAMKITYNIE